MATGEFAKRERALENAFFHQVDEQLIAQMRQRNAAAERRQALADACPWASDAVIDAVDGADITAESLSALTLVPLVQVAWADGRVELNEREAILKAADENKWPKDSDGYKLLESWLNRRPPAGLFQAWQEYTAELGTQLTDEAKAELKQQVVHGIRVVGKATGGILGIAAISKVESDVIATIEAAFEA